MKIAELKGDKTVQALAKRLLKEAHSDTAPGELAATLLRLNPHLSQIEQLEEGIPVLLPPDFASDDRSTPFPGATDQLMQQADDALQALRSALKENAAQDGEEAEQAQAWLKGDQAKQILREAPELKEVFSKTATAAGKVRKEQAAFLAGQEKALRQLQTELAEFQKKKATETER